MRALLFSLIALRCSPARTGQQATAPLRPPSTPSQPQGVARGATLEMTVEGLNLAKASQVYFSQPGIKARILRIKELPDGPISGWARTAPLHRRPGPAAAAQPGHARTGCQPGAPVGPVNFRLQTPLGTSPEARFLVEPYYGETPDKEPNDNPEEAFETYAPTILVGAISKPGDVDYYKIHVKAGRNWYSKTPP